MAAFLEMRKLVAALEDPDCLQLRASVASGQSVRVACLSAKRGGPAFALLLARSRFVRGCVG
jgi:hypothetical protein